MTAATPTFPVIREAVASFPDRSHFRNAVAALLVAGFEPSDLSVLASHEALSAADEKPGELIAAGLTDEIKYIGPLTIAGIILISGGPIAATLAALVGAGLGGAALKELFDDYAAAPHRDGVRRGAQGRRGPLMGALRRFRARIARLADTRRSRRAACPYPRPARRKPPCLTRP